MSQTQTPNAIGTHAAKPPSSHAPARSGAADEVGLWPRNLVVDMATIDIHASVAGKHELEKLIPHRGQMSLLDRIIWRNAEATQGVAVKHVRDDEFWVAGHFPGRPLLPGVLQVEASAQLAVYLYNARRDTPLTAAFTRIENCSFRSMVVPGDDLYLICKEIKSTRRGFVCTAQGVANNKLTFEAEIHGLSV